MAISPDKQLELYNAALRLCKERQIARLTVDERPRRELDSVWNLHKGALNHCLRQALWNFATRTVRIEQTPDVTQDFGYTYAFSKPDDWVRTIEVSSDETFVTPLLDVRDEQAYWFANIDPIYVRFVSERQDYGGNPSLWPQTFFEYFAGYLASEVVWPITQSGDTTDEVKQEHMNRLNDARSKDAMDEATKSFAQGRWPRSRYSRRSRDDLGPRNRLIG